MVECWSVSDEHTDVSAFTNFFLTRALMRAAVLYLWSHVAWGQVFTLLQSDAATGACQRRRGLLAASLGL